ncbi:MAG: hypothetical protein JEZ14_07475 [Marinilabiliaceae bacterium]|nr:hypothetical protein [Marinilabiliaceae bacterium]
MPNSWGAYAEEREYFENGLLKKQASLDQFGEYCIDRAGNTGQMFEYNSDKQMIKAISFGEDGNICCTKNGVATYRFEYDKDGNQVKQSYFNKYGEPCINLDNGSYGSAYEYNERGKITKTKLLARNLKDLMNGNVLDGAVYSRSYDRFGNETSWEIFNKEGRYSQDVNGISKYSYNYNADNEIIEKSQFKYLSEEDSLRLVYFYKRWQNEKGLDTLRYCYDVSDSIIVWCVKEAYDEYNNQEYWGYFDKHLNPLSYVDTDEDRTYHCWEDETYYGDTVVYLRTYYDVNGNMIEHHKAMQKDTWLNNKLLSRLYLNKDSIIQSGLVYEYDRSGQRKSQSFVGRSNKPYRGDPSAKYIKARILYALNGDCAEYYGYNEFGEKSLVEHNDKVFFGYNAIYDKYYDVDNIEIKDMEEYANSLNQAVQINLTNTSTREAINFIKDGDILVKYGRWNYNSSNDFSFLVEESNRLESDEKNIAIIRLPDKKLIEIIMPKGKMGLRFQSIYLTQDEYERINSIQRPIAQDTRSISNVDIDFYSKSGVFVDKRDNKTYKWVKFNKLIWMVDNLAYKPQEGEFWPYRDRSSNVSKYGYFYNWEAAYANCPEGWRLPTWQELSDFMLQYGVIAYSGDNTEFEKKFGEYNPRNSHSTFENLTNDLRVNIPVLDAVDNKNIRTMFWTKDLDETKERAYAIYWRPIDQYIDYNTVHFSSYPLNFLGFCRYVKEVK